MFKGYCILEDEIEFHKQNPDIGTMHIKGAVRHCPLARKEERRFLKDIERNEEIYGINKIYDHVLNCDYCQNYLDWMKDMDMRYRDPEKYEKKMLSLMFGEESLSRIEALSKLSGLDPEKDKTLMLFLIKIFTKG